MDQTLNIHARKLQVHVTEMFKVAIGKSTSNRRF